MSRPARCRGLLLPLLLLLALGGCKKQAKEAPPEPAIERLNDIVVGPAPECSGGSGAECASGVCVDGFCVTLVNAGQTWMIDEMAIRVNALIKEDPRLITVLVDAYAPKFAEEDVFVHARFARLLGTLHDEGANQVLLGWSRTTRERVAVTAQLALCQQGWEPSFDGCMELLDHRSEPVRLSALTSLARFTAHTTAARDAMLDLLEAESHRIRQRAIRMLPEVAAGDAEARLALTAILASEGDAYLHHDVRAALTAMGAAPP